MSLNTFLCKHFKDSDERYVTVAGFLQWLGIYIAVFLIIVGIIASNIITVSRIATGQYGKATDPFIAFAETMGTIGIAVILFVISALLWGYLSDIKLAECPLERGIKSHEMS